MTATIAALRADLAHNEIVVGVDAHKDVHIAAVTDLLGRVLASAVFPADAASYRELLGVSTRRVERLAQRRWVTQLSKSQVTEMAKTPDVTPPLWTRSGRAGRGRRTRRSTAVAGPGGGL